MERITILQEQLNAPTAEERLCALRELKRLHEAGKLPGPKEPKHVNNHIHTTFSFSPYSPAKAIYTAWENGLLTAGIMDHDSVAGAEEFIEAGKIMEIATTVALECRINFSETPFRGKKINNPDQLSNAYVGLHAIPHQNLARVHQVMAPLRERRNARNRKMVDNINQLFSGTGVAIDFEEDVLPLSEYRNGGGVTERHVLYALSLRILQLTGKGEPLLAFLQKMEIVPTGAVAERLRDPENPVCAYDLLGLLKSALVGRFYVAATDECMQIPEFIALAKQTGAIAAYAYLGDVTESVTGDKKAQFFEDAYLDDFIPAVAQMGFHAVTYAPTRNTLEQLFRLGKLCEANNLFQISGEDINSPRQSFKNDLILTKPFHHLVVNTWAMIGHELAATQNQQDGMFSEETVKKYPKVKDRIPLFYEKGKILWKEIE